MTTGLNDDIDEGLPPELINEPQPDTSSDDTIVKKVILVADPAAQTPDTSKILTPAILLGDDLTGKKNVILEGQLLVVKECLAKHRDLSDLRDSIYRRGCVSRGQVDALISIENTVKDGVLLSAFTETASKMGMARIEPLLEVAVKNTSTVTIFALQALIETSLAQVTATLNSMLKVRDVDLPSYLDSRLIVARVFQKELESPNYPMAVFLCKCSLYEFLEATSRELIKNTSTYFPLNNDIYVPVSELKEGDDSYRTFRSMFRMHLSQDFFTKLTTEYVDQVETIKRTFEEHKEKLRNFTPETPHEVLNSTLGVIVDGLELASSLSSSYVKKIKNVTCLTLILSILDKKLFI